MIRVTNTKQLVAFAEESDKVLAEIRKTLNAEIEKWRDCRGSHLETRISTAARGTGLDETVINEYVGSIMVSMDRIIAGMGASVDDLQAISVNMGSVAHCAEAIRHKAQRAREERREGFVL